MSWVAPTPKAAAPTTEEWSRNASLVAGDFFHDDVMVVCMCDLPFIFCIISCTYLIMLFILFVYSIYFITYSFIHLSMYYIVSTHPPLLVLLLSLVIFNVTPPLSPSPLYF